MSDKKFVGTLSKEDLILLRDINSQVMFDIKEPLNQPYLTVVKLSVEKVWNPDYNETAICNCGHEYYRHFDSYDNNEACGCKYCRCDDFIPETDE